MTAEPEMRDDNGKPDPFAVPLTQPEMKLRCRTGWHCRLRSLHRHVHSGIVLWSCPHCGEVLASFTEDRPKTRKELSR